MKGRKEGNMLKAGSGQAYADDNCINKPKIKVGTGIYVSPHIQETLAYAQPVAVNNQNYRLIFQCRARPSTIHIPKRKNEYWVIGNRYDLRPYGILLIEEKDVKKIMSA